MPRVHTEPKTGAIDPIIPFINWSKILLSRKSPIFRDFGQKIFFLQKSKIFSQGFLGATITHTLTKNQVCRSKNGVGDGFLAICMEMYGNVRENPIFCNFERKILANGESFFNSVKSVVLVSLK